MRQPFLVVVGSFLLDFFSLVDGDLNRRVSAFSSCRAARFGEVLFFLDLLLPRDSFDGDVFF